MKKNSALCLLVGLATLPVAAFAQDSAQPGPHHPGKEGRAPRGPEDSLRIKSFQEGARLRRDISEKRRAYFEAISDKKDEAAKKSELMTALDKLNAYQKKQLEEIAQRFAKMPKDTGRDLRRESFKARKAYFEAVIAKKDEASKKAAYFAALDKVVAYEKAHVDEAAARFAKNPKGEHKGPGMRHPGREGFGFQGQNCPKHSQGMTEGPMMSPAPMAEAPEGQAEEEFAMGPENDMGPMADADFGADDNFPEPQD